MPRTSIEKSNGVVLSLHPDLWERPEKVLVGYETYSRTPRLSPYTTGKDERNKRKNATQKTPRNRRFLFALKRAPAIA